MKNRQLARKVGKPSKKVGELPKAKKKTLDLTALHDSIMQLSEDDKIRFTNVMHGYLSGKLPPKE